MTIVNKILEKAFKARDDKSLPIIVSSNDYPIITESRTVIKKLEDNGFTVDTYVDKANSAYGLRIS